MGVGWGCRVGGRRGGRSPRDRIRFAAGCHLDGCDEASVSRKSPLADDVEGVGIRRDEEHLGRFEVERGDCERAKVEGVIGAHDDSTDARVSPRIRECRFVERRSLAQQVYRLDPCKRREMTNEMTWEE